MSALKGREGRRERKYRCNLLSKKLGKNIFKQNGRILIIFLASSLTRRQNCISEIYTPLTPLDCLGQCRVGWVSKLQKVNIRRPSHTLYACSAQALLNGCLRLSKWIFYVFLHYSCCRVSFPKFDRNSECENFFFQRVRYHTSDSCFHNAVPPPQAPIRVFLPPFPHTFPRHRN